MGPKLWGEFENGTVDEIDGAVFRSSNPDRRRRRYLRCSVLPFRSEALRFVTGFAIFQV